MPRLSLREGRAARFDQFLAGLRWEYECLRKTAEALEGQITGFRAGDVGEGDPKHRSAESLSESALMFASTSETLAPSAAHGDSCLKPQKKQDPKQPHVPPGAGPLPLPRAPAEPEAGAQFALDECLSLKEQAGAQFAPDECWSLKEQVREAPHPTRSEGQQATATASEGSALTTESTPKGTKRTSLPMPEDSPIVYSYPQINTTGPFVSGAVSSQTLSTVGSGNFGRTSLGSAATYKSRVSEVSSMFASETAPVPFWQLLRESPRKAGRRLVHSPVFEGISGVVVMLSIFFVGFETHYSAVHMGDVHEMHNTAHNFINGFFMIELGARMGVDGLISFFSGRHWRWNLLDTFVVATSIADLGLSSRELDGSSGFAATAGRQLRAIRVMRLFRTLRLLRSLRSIHEFRKMLYAIISSLRTLVCSLVLLFYVMYFFAVFVCSGVTDYRAQASQAQEEHNQEMERMYGSLAKSIYTLFCAVTNGVSWADTVVVLNDLHILYRVALVVYISVVIFGVANVVTSVFVESAIMTAQHYKELIVDEKEHMKQVALYHMQQVFKEMDTDGSGALSIKEMEHVMSDPHLKCYVDALDISSEDARLFFRLLDVDGSGSIDIDEFTNGCLRLQGEAKRIDVHQLIHQMNIFLTRFSKFAEFVDMKFSELGLSVGADMQMWNRNTMAREVTCRKWSARSSNPLAGIPGQHARTSSDST